MNLEVPGSSLSECHYSMRLDQLQRAYYPSLDPFMVMIVPALSNIKTATGCESNKTVVTLNCVYRHSCVQLLTNISMAFKDVPDTCIK